MARTPAETKTTSGAKTVTVSADLPTDLGALLTQSLGDYGPQPGELSRKQLLEKAGGSEYKLARFLTDHAGRIKKRRCGNTMLYRLG
jgi:hypothetical protein